MGKFSTHVDGKFMELQDIDGCLDLANKNIKYLFEMQQERLTKTHRQAYGFSPKIYNY